MKFFFAEYCHFDNGAASVSFTFTTSDNIGEYVTIIQASGLPCCNACVNAGKIKYLPRRPAEFNLVSEV